jgi:hypothetical protein
MMRAIHMQGDDLDLMLLVENAIRFVCSRHEESYFLLALRFSPYFLLAYIFFVLALACMHIYISV